MSVTTSNPWLERLLSSHSMRPSEQTGWLTKLRGQALERANSLALPSVRQEAWRFTDLSPLYQAAFTSAESASVPAGLALEPVIATEAGARVVFIDGQFVPALSVLTDGSVTVSTLASSVDRHGHVIQRHLAQRATFDDDAFCAINTVHLADGALVIAQGNAAVRAPVQIVYATTQTDVAIHPRCLVVAEAGSDVTVIEDYVGLHKGAYWANAVTEVVVSQNARVRHVRRQQDSDAAFHIGTCAARLDRDATYESVSIALGARLSRYNLFVQQAGEGVRCSLDGLAVIDERRLADTHSFIDHAAPHGTSRQLHKCIVGGHAHGVFNGRILVRRGAQLTDSGQQSRNLLLSRRAHVDTKPQLEIFADDVKCAHGATVGQLDTEELFYLRSRGLSEAAARALLTYGFAAEIVDRVPIASVSAALRRAVLERTHTEEVA